MVGNDNALWGAMIIHNGWADDKIGVILIRDRLRLVVVCLHCRFGTD
jgi:hypothetical protein